MTKPKEDFEELIAHPERVISRGNEELSQAAEDHRAGKLSREEFRRIQGHTLPEPAR